MDRDKSTTVSFHASRPACHAGLRLNLLAVRSPMKIVGTRVCDETIYVDQSNAPLKKPPE